MARSSGSRPWFVVSFLFALAVFGVRAARSEGGKGATAGPKPILEHLRLPDAHRQVLFVETEDWSTTKGQMSLWERPGVTWRPVWTPISVVVGRSGMGWGRGRNLRPIFAGPIKREGDGRSPAGVFSLGPAFGYEDRSRPKGHGFPYRVATERDFFVDDPWSLDYNKWVRLSPGVDPRTVWRSCENMRLPSDVYALGLVVHHNMSPQVPGAGSAIFIHIWGKRGPESVTAGCTAMGREDLETVVDWLDPKLEPLLVQGPREALNRMTMRGDAHILRSDDRQDPIPANERMRTALESKP